MADERLYADRDHCELEPYYCAHVSAMTGEALHAKSAIAAELAFRDKRIAELEEEVRKLRAPREPRAWMRRWAYDGEAEYRVRDETTGRMRLARKFIFKPVTPNRVFSSDVALYADPPADVADAQGGGE